MILDKLYVDFLDFYCSIQDEYQHCGISESEWESFHLKFLLYYIVRYKISNFILLFFKKCIGFLYV